MTTLSELGYSSPLRRFSGARVQPSSELESPSLLRKFSSQIEDPRSEDDNEQGFRFLDLPAEIRNMIYQLALIPHSRRSGKQLALCLHIDLNDEDVLRNDWLPPPLAFVDKRTRKESLQIFYCFNVFRFEWNPAGIRHEEPKRSRVFKAFDGSLRFLRNNELQMGRLSVCAPLHPTVWPDRPRSVVPFVISTHPLVEFVQHIAPLVVSSSRQAKTQATYQIVRKIAFGSPSAKFYRFLWNFARRFAIAAHDFDDRELVDSKLRKACASHPEYIDILLETEEYEAELAFQRDYDRLVKESARRKADMEKGTKRWNGVLRGRITKEKDMRKTKEEEAAREGQQRWKGVLRGRDSGGQKD